MNESLDKLRHNISALFTQEVIEKIKNQYNKSNPILIDFSVAVSRILIDYSSYKNDTEQPDTFDDPYVGAAIITFNGHLVSAHRKRSQGEIHAEPQAVLNALEEVNTEEAKDLISAIREAYKKKSWLAGTEERDTFLEYFKKACSLIRTFARQIFQEDELIFLSTLEPCRDFESNPSCATIISHFKPDLVIYGCDDTNSKGQGKPILLQNKLNLISNVAPQETVDSNKLFFSAVFFVQKLHKTAIERSNPFGLFYSTVDLSRVLPKVIAEPNRLHIDFRDRDIVIKQAQIDPRLKLSETYDLPILNKEKIDANRVFFINKFDSYFVALYLNHCEKNGILLPSRIICCQSDEQDCNTKTLIEKIESYGIKVFRNAFRMTDERYLASQLIYRHFDLYKLEQFYMTIKFKSGYEVIIGSNEACLAKIKDVIKSVINENDENPPKKIELFMSRQMGKEAKEFIDSISKHSLFKEGVASQISYKLVICTDEEDDSLKEELDFHLDNKGLSYKFTIDVLLPWANFDSIEHLNYDTEFGIFDPVTLNSKVYDSILNSESWLGRLHGGLFISSACNQDIALRQHLVMEKFHPTYNSANWKKICTLLNSISKIEWNENELSSLIERLSKFTDSICREESTFKQPQIEDVIWRLLSATASLYKKDNNALKVINKEKLIRHLCSDLFLIKELLYYYLKKISGTQDFTTFALDLAKRSITNLNIEHKKQLIVRAARIASILDPEKRSIIQLAIDKGQQFELETNLKEVYIQELELCKNILSEGMEYFLTLPPDKRFEAFGTYLFLSTNKKPHANEPYSEGLVDAFKYEFNKFFENRLAIKPDLIYWRGDKIAVARIFLSEYISDYYKFLQATSKDEDETIRWATIELALDTKKRIAYFSYLKKQKEYFQFDEINEKAICLKIRNTISNIIKNCIETSRCYWLERELLRLFHDEHFEDSEIPVKLRIQYLDLSDVLDSIFNRKKEELHPEILLKLKRLNKKQKRIGLVLPPLNFSQQEQLTKSTTPSLGLGTLCTVLSEAGHVVKLYDCHRFPSVNKGLTEELSNFDFVGFSVVSPTFLSTQEIVSRLMNQCTLKGTPMPKIILGGHAVSLHPNDFISKETFYWDYLISGDGEKQVLNIVNGNFQNDMNGFKTRENVITERGKIQKNLISSSEWDTQSWIDRRVYKNEVEYYEPSRSRNGQTYEAHMVISKGCSWKCSFCTEAILRGSQGEIRRNAVDIAHEIIWLLEETDVRRIQFIDDNLLPQLGAPGQKANYESGVEWIKKFFTFLIEIKKKHVLFSWRGIMRFEDYIVYDQLYNGNFSEILKKSGCNLLAFGVEKGNEEIRAKLKMGTVSNSTIISIVKKLRTKSIFAKGYFIIGGDGENMDSVSESIELAKNAGFALAYFSLYKNFRKLISTSTHSMQTLNEERVRKYLQYRTFTSNASTSLFKIDTVQDATMDLGWVYTEEELSTARSTIIKLENLGFNFSDLFKYNDFHQSMDEFNDDLKVWNSSSTRPKHDFLQAVKRSYFEFYFREDFLLDYKSLLDSGY